MSSDMRRDINVLTKAVEKTSADLASTNAALMRAVEGLNATNAKFDITNAALVGTNAKLDITNADLASTNSDLSTTNSKLNRTMVSVAKLVGGMADMKRYLAENMATKKDISDLSTRMDGFSGLLLDSRHRWAVHAETLVDHDARLKSLESKAS